jgi:hypothetical protein
MHIFSAILLLACAVSAVSTVSTQCSLPTTYSWVDSGVLAVPKKARTSLQDFTHVPYEGKHLLYASYNLGGVSGSMVFGSLSNWTEMASVDQTEMKAVRDSTISPTLFFFRPKQIWVMAYQTQG